MSSEDRGFGRGWIPLGRDIGVPGEERWRSGAGPGGAASGAAAGSGDPAVGCAWVPAVPDRVRDDDVAIAGGLAASRRREGDGGASFRDDAFTPERRVVFLDVLSREGSVRAAAGRAGVSRQTAYLARRRDAAFARGWAAALVLARAHVEDVLGARALHGVAEDVFYHGEKIATRVRFDARLLLAHLARLDRLADASDAGEDAQRFDELVAIVGGMRPGAAMFEAVSPEEAEDDPLLPLTRAEYAVRAFDDAEAARLAALDAAEDEEAGEDAGDDAEDAGFDDYYAELEADLADDGMDDGPDGWSDEDIAALAAVRADALARWDGWRDFACRFVDAARAEVPCGEEPGGEEPGAEGAMEYKSLDFLPLDRVNRVNFGRLMPLRRAARRWYAARQHRASGGGCGAEGTVMAAGDRFPAGRRAVMAALALGVAAPAHAQGGDSVVMVANLTGAQVVGRPADTDGSGRFVGALTPRTRQLCYELEARLIGQVTVAAIYGGRTGRAPGSGLATLTAPDQRGNAKGCVTLSRSAAKSLANDPSAAHVSLHNALYPAGALRGQLAPGGPGLSAAEGQADALPVPPSAAAGGYTGPAGN